MAKPTRADRVKQVAELQQQGWTRKEIGQLLDLSTQTVSEYIADPDGMKRKARELSYAGECEVCGKLTSGSNGRDQAPRFCATHAPKTAADKARGNGPRQKQLRAFLGSGSAYFYEICDATGMGKEHASQLLHRAVREGWVTRISRGLYRLT